LLVCVAQVAAVPQGGPGSASRSAATSGIVRLVKAGRLITVSSTTGWTDWIHGELWLFSDGLLRVRTGLRTTIGNGVVPVSGDPPTRSFGEEEVVELSNKHHKNYWIASSSILAASLRRGVTTSRLSMHLQDGRGVKLLWLRSDPAESLLRVALIGWGVDV
jgi:hypothetical protein